MPRRSIVHAGHEVRLCWDLMPQTFYEKIHEFYQQVDASFIQFKYIQNNRMDDKDLKGLDDLSGRSAHP